MSSIGMKIEIFGSDSISSGGFNLYVYFSLNVTVTVKITPTGFPST